MEPGLLFVLRLAMNVKASQRAGGQAGDKLYLPPACCTLFQPVHSLLPQNQGSGRSCFPDVLQEHASAQGQAGGH